MSPLLRWVAAPIAGLLMGHAMAQLDAPKAQVEQRVQLTAKLIGDSPTAQRIAASGRREAIAAFDESRVHQSLAEDLLRKGDLEGARKAADEALRQIGLARRLVPDSPSRSAAARARHEQMTASLERLMESWHARGGAAIGQDGDHFYAMELMETARVLARDSRHEEAVYALSQAEGHVLSGMKRLLHATTLDYTVRAETPAQELALEIARHRSLVDLVPIAVSELKPAPDAAALIERYQVSSRALQAQAQQSAQRGDTAQALAQIRHATQFLQRALGAAGVVTPQPAGSPP